MSDLIYIEWEEVAISKCVLLLPSVMLCQENRESCFLLTDNAFSHQIKLRLDWFPSVSTVWRLPVCWRLVGATFQCLQHATSKQ